jgi:uncharacterized protein YcaQ
VPQDKRKYGYYVLPVLYRNNLIARFEPLKHVEGQPFRIKNWWWEPAYREEDKITNPDIKEAVIRGLENFAKYLKADGVDSKSLLYIF